MSGACTCTWARGPVSRARARGALSNPFTSLKTEPHLPPAAGDRVPRRDRGMAERPGRREIEGIGGRLVRARPLSVRSDSEREGVGASVAC